MSSLSSYTENLFISWMTQNSAMPAAPNPIYLALSLADPLDDHSGVNEPTGIGAYVRMPIAFGAVSQVVGVGSTVTNSGSIVFPTATADIGTISHGFISDALVAGNVLCFFSFAVPKLINTGDTFSVAIGDISLLIR